MEATFGPECFHTCDYGFFYNIRENAANRVQKWLEANPVAERK